MGKMNHGSCFSDMVIREMQRWQDGYYDAPKVTVETISERPLVVAVVDDRGVQRRRSPHLVISKRVTEGATRLIKYDDFD